MGRDGIVIAGVLGVLAVIALWRWADPVLWVLGWPRRYLRARGYEHELARHTARALLEDIEPLATYATVTIPRTETRGDPPAGLFPDLEPRWASDIEHEGGTLPAWAAPDADRSSAYGLNSGSSGSDYHGGELPPAGEGGARRPMGMGTRAAGGPEPEPYGVTAPATLSPDDERLDKTWDRLLAAWGSAAGGWSREGSAESPQPARALDSGAVERGREGCQGTGVATHGDPLGSTGRGGAVPVTAAAAPGPGDDAAAPSPGPGSRLATRFDVELAAECARWIREQDKDVTDYLERLLGVTW